MWKEMKGKEATYQALIKAAEDAKAQNLADSVRAMHMKLETTPPPHMGGVYSFLKDVCILYFTAMPHPQVWLPVTNYVQTEMSHSHMCLY